VAELWGYIGCMSHRHLNRQFFVYRTYVPKPPNSPLEMEIVVTMISNEKWNTLVRVFFWIVAITSVSDIFADIRQGAHVLHMLQETMMFLFALSLLWILYQRTKAQVKRNEQLQTELDEARALSTKASKELIDAKRIFGEEITRQFSSWSLTESEAEVALFSLKGFSAKEIANLRNTSEKTVRNQLTSVYSKSGTTSKLSFVAWFMEGLT
jgi:DNA-binding CsgD family transcriptional regulator